MVALRPDFKPYSGEITALTILGASIIETDDIGVYALGYGSRGWEVFPLRGKAPAIRSAHPAGDPQRGKCRGQCGRDGHGLFDATADLEKISSWWEGPYKGANIGIRPHQNVLVIDIDPRNGGEDSLALLSSFHGSLPETMTAASGRGDGGRHLYYRAPAGKLSAARLGDGLDLKTRAGYLVAPPSIHPDTGSAYWWDVKTSVAAPPEWLVDLIRPTVRTCTDSDRTDTKGKKGTSLRFLTMHDSDTTDRSGFSTVGPSIADRYSATTSWAQILEPHGWICLDIDGDGARWLHPSATSATSAAIQHGVLFVFSTSTVFDPTEPGSPAGYTKFRAYALLNFDGDMSSAARALKERG